MPNFSRFAKKILFEISPEYIEVGCYTPFDAIVINILGAIKAFKKNRDFKILNKNQVCLFDSALFMLFLVEKLYPSLKCYTTKQQDIINSELITKLYIGYKKAFKTPFSIDNALNRIFYYNDIFEMDSDTSTLDENIKSVFSEFQLIIQMDYVINKFQEYKHNSPVYLLNSLENMFYLDKETKFLFDYVIENFSDYIIQLTKFDMTNLYNSIK